MRPLGILVCSIVLYCGARALAQEVAIEVYGQTSNTKETHVMPRVVVRTPRSIPWRAEASYLVDVSSRASIDLRTGTSLDESQTQHELSGAMSYDGSALRAKAHYRYVDRSDYVSHTISLPVAYGFADWASHVSLQPYVRFNEISRIGDPNFSRSSQMFGARIGFQPWLDSRSVAQIAYELQVATGYLSSPYAYVGVGAADPDGCPLSALVCLPENNPDTRLQHAAVLMGRRALSESASIGLTYRLFFDDWAMISHTVEPDVAWLAWEGGLLRLRYRAYFQTATTAYQNVQPASFAPVRATSDTARAIAELNYVTADARWSQLQTHRVSFDLWHTLYANRSGLGLDGLISLGMLRIAYADEYHDDVTALEGTLALAFGF